MLDLDHAERIVHEPSQYLDYFWIEYKIPPASGYAPWQIQDQAFRFLGASNPPECLRIYLDYRACLLQSDGASSGFVGRINLE